MEQQITTYELGIWRAQITDLLNQLDALCMYDEQFKVVNRKNPTEWKYACNGDVSFLRVCLEKAGESIDVIANI